MNGENTLNAYGAYTQNVLRGVKRRRLVHLNNKKCFFSVNK